MKKCYIFHRNVPIKNIIGVNPSPKYFQPQIQKCRNYKRSLLWNTVHNKNICIIFWQKGYYFLPKNGGTTKTLKGIITLIFYIGMTL